MKGERASEWSSEWDEKHRSSSSRHQHLYHHHHHHHQSSSSIGIAYLSWDSNDHPMDCPATWRICKWGRMRESEWVIEWVRWKTSIIIITSSIITRHRTAMIIRWAVQQPEESASDGEWVRASEWLSEWDERHRSSSSRHQHLYHHHQSKLLTCHGTAMIIRWTTRSRDF